MLAFFNIPQTCMWTQKPDHAIIADSDAATSVKGVFGNSANK